jgi:hypothetical protein
VGVDDDPRLVVEAGAKDCQPGPVTSGPGSLKIVASPRKAETTLTVRRELPTPSTNRAATPAP